MKIQSPYLLFLGEPRDWLAAKTAVGIRDWRPDNCVGQLRFPGVKVDLGLPDLTPAEAAAKGAKTLVVGTAVPGGKFPDSWLGVFDAALDAGLDIANGLHRRIAALPGVADKARALDRSIIDVRHPDEDYPIGTGRKRTGKRLLTVGTDCSVGKMYTSLAIEREMQARGINADFRATGQTGILICGSGVPVDAVVSDFIAGSIEWLTPDAADDHWDIIEGQGSLFHASFAGVSMGLLHGSQADVLVICHEPTRTHMRGLEHMPVPGLKETLERNVEAARLTNPAVRAGGFAVNTSALSPSDADDLLKRIADDFGLPAVDPVRNGAGALVDAIAV